MSCQTFVVLENNLTFTITTHDPDTGALTDADSAPSYRVYEDETATAILTGTMSKLDDANTTGFYSEQIACTAANGFEAGKSYNIYIEATVDSDTGAISYGFTVLTSAPVSAATIWAYSSRTLTQAAASVTAAVSGSTITVYRGTTWDITLTGLGDISSRTKLYFTVKRDVDDADSAAWAQIMKSNPADAGADGLIVLNGSSDTTKAQGSITVNDESTGSITIVLAAAASIVLAARTKLHYDVKMLTASTADLLTIGEGAFTHENAVTQAVT